MFLFGIFGFFSFFIFNRLVSSSVRPSVCLSVFCVFIWNEAALVWEDLKCKSCNFFFYNCNFVWRTWKIKKPLSNIICTIVCLSVFLSDMWSWCAEDLTRMMHNTTAQLNFSLISRHEQLANVIIRFGGFSIDLRS